MTRLAVCVCTLKNPSGLKQLLDGLDAQQLGDAGVPQVTVGIVDNDAGESASEVLRAYQAHGRFPLEVCKQPRRGLSTARNSALDLACVRASDFFAFLDDDEIPSAGWLASLLRAFDVPERVVVVGPVAPLFVSTPPAWVVAGEFFHKRCPADTAHPGHTSNVMMRTANVLATGIRFDERLNSIGGEDVTFFKELEAKGYRVHCCPDAWVHETIPASRAGISWMMRRWLRAGATSLRLSDGRGGLRGRLRALAQGLVRLGGGSLRLLILAVTRGRRDVPSLVNALSTVCRGAGMLMSAFGMTYREYGQSYRRRPSQHAAN